MSPKTLVIAGVLSLLPSCSRYVIASRDYESSQPIEVSVMEPLESVTEKLRKYLRQRSRVESLHRSTSLPATVSMTQPWIRDTSLRYYFNEFDIRKRHLCEWKAQWKLRALSPGSTRIGLTVLELIFIGPYDQSGTRAEASNAQEGIIISDWFETDPDNVRAALEVRRFWIENFPLSPLPISLADINVPSLEGAPLSRASLKREWPALKRRRAF